MQTVKFVLTALMEIHYACFYKQHEPDSKFEGNHLAVKFVKIEMHEQNILYVTADLI